MILAISGHNLPLHFRQRRPESPPNVLILLDPGPPYFRRYCRRRAKDTVFWDRDLAGFGVRVHATGRKVYVVQSRGPGGLKRVTLGHHGDMAADEARKRAAVVIDRIKRGEPPVPVPPAPELTVAALAERYMRAHVLVRCKSSTAGTYRFVLDRHILPALGETPVGAVGRSDIAALHHRLRTTPTMANATVDILSKMFSLAEAWDRVPPGRNPCRAVRRYKTRTRERFLTQEEFRRLGEGVERRRSRWLGVGRRPSRQSGCCC